MFLFIYVSAVEVKGSLYVTALYAVIYLQFWLWGSAKIWSVVYLSLVLRGREGIDIFLHSENRAVDENSLMHSRVV